LLALPLSCSTLPSAQGGEEISLAEMKQLIYGRRVSREDEPTRYESMILTLAKDVLIRGLESDLESRAAQLAGFSSWSELDRARPAEASGHEARLARWKRLAESALAASTAIQDSAIRALDNPRFLTIREFGAQWQPADQMGLVALEDGSAHRFDTSTSVGDRVFTLRYYSAASPEVDAMLRALKARPNRVRNEPTAAD
jgi:hypothetical protein